MHAEQVMYILLGKYVVKYLVALRAYGAKNLDKAYCKCSFNLFCIIKKIIVACAFTPASAQPFFKQLHILIKKRTQSSEIRMCYSTVSYVTE